MDDAPANGMSGAWSRPFVLDRTGMVEITLRFKMAASGNEEFGEDCQTLLSVDGNLLGSSPEVDFLAELKGDSTSKTMKTTGWISITVSAGTLNAGEHTVAIGGYFRRKTHSSEIALMIFESVSIMRT